METENSCKPKTLIMAKKNTHHSKCATPSWNNSHNRAMYRKMPIPYLAKGAIEGGLDDGCDVKAITIYIKKAKSILEAGAGYGRALQFIIASDFSGRLYAVEREPKLCRFLRRKYPQIKVICDDMRHFKMKYKFDLILLLWASLSEFCKAEQLLTLKNFVAHLNRDGYLIFDSIPLGCKTIRAITYDKHNKVVKTPYGDDRIYLPSLQEIELYAQKLHLSVEKIITYKTKTNRKRNLYVLRKI